MKSVNPSPSTSSSSTSSSNMQPPPSSRSSNGALRSQPILSSTTKDRASSSSASYPSTVASANLAYPKGMVVVSQTQPRTQKIVVGHMMSSAEVPRVLIYQAGFQRMGSTAWNPPGLVNRLTNKLPQQDTPATALFPDMELVKEHLAPLLELDSKVADDQVKILTNLLTAAHHETITLRLLGPSILSVKEYELYTCPPHEGPLADPLRSEPSVDYVLKAFLENAIRANPEGDIPPGLDPTQGISAPLPTQITNKDEDLTTECWALRRKEPPARQPPTTPNIPPMLRNEQGSTPTRAHAPRAIRAPTHPSLQPRNGHYPS